MEMRLLGGARVKSGRKLELNNGDHGVVAKEARQMAGSH